MHVNLKILQPVFEHYAFKVVWFTMACSLCVLVYGIGWVLSLFLQGKSYRANKSDAVGIVEIAEGSDPVLNHEL
eukprot:4163875-Amphidinium_carterae.1